MCGSIMVIYPEGVWYRCRKVEDVEELLRVHLIGGGRIGGGWVGRLMLRPEDEAPES